MRHLRNALLLLRANPGDVRTELDASGSIGSKAGEGSGGSGPAPLILMLALVARMHRVRRPSWSAA